MPPDLEGGVFGGAGADARAAADAPADVADTADADAADVADAFDAADAAGAADAADEADTADDADEADATDAFCIAINPDAATMRPPDEAADPAVAPEGGTRKPSATEETGCNCV